MKIEIVADAAKGCALGARLFVEKSTANPAAPLGLATGATMRGVYAELVAKGFRPRCEDVFLLDEYLGLPSGSPESFEYEIRTRFCEPLHYTGRVHVPGAGKYSGDDGPRKFEEELLRSGPIGVQLLGIGTNGHIAFNEPGSPADSLTRVVRLADETREANAQHFPPDSEIPTQAVSQGLATINRALSLVLLAFGAAKKEALVSALTEDNPIHPLRSLLGHCDLTIITDIELP